MIATFRDTENELRQLKSEIETLKKQVRFLSNQENEVITKEVKVDAIDSELSAAGTQVWHQLYHIFQKIKTNVIEITDATIQNLTAGTLNVLGTLSANIANLKEIVTNKITVNDPTYGRGWTIENLSNYPEVSGGQKGLKFKSPFNVELMGFYNNHPNFPGVSLNHIFPATHMIPTIHNSFYLGHPSYYWSNFYCTNIQGNVGNIVTINATDVKTDAAGNYFCVADGQTYWGVNGAEASSVYSINPITDVINYKDHGNVNQSKTVVTGIQVGSIAVKYRKGLRVG